MLRGILLSGLAVSLSGCAYLAYWSRFAGLAAFSPEESLILLTITVWLCFLIGLVIALLASTDKQGMIRTPGSLSGLIVWLAMIPSSGLAIGSLIHYADTKAIVLANASAAGVKAYIVEKRWASIDGRIGPSTVRSLQDISPRNQLDFLTLDSPGGSIEAARQLVSFVEASGLTVIVTGACESACVPVALAGQNLRVSRNAQFGFHQGSAVAERHSETGRFIGSIGTELMLEDLRAMGLPGWLLDQAKQTPPDQIYRIDGKKMIELGLAQPL